MLEAVSRNYPGTEAGAKALFLSAFLHNNELGNVTLAQNLYSKFIREYPEHPFVKDAKLEIQYIGKTPEEILEASQNSNSDK
jgi:outer membrane protein assembly factor BamD (BamD/ComL family)